MLVAAAAAFVLLPFARGAAALSLSRGHPTSPPTVCDCIGRFWSWSSTRTWQVVGRGFRAASRELLAEAGAGAAGEQGTLSEIDAEIEREIAAARAAFARPGDRPRDDRTDPSCENDVQVGRPRMSMSQPAMDGHNPGCASRAVRTSSLVAGFVVSLATARGGRAD